MGVAVDKAGHGHHAGAVNHGFRRLLGGRAGDGDNFPALNANVSAEDNLHFGVHGHRSDICNQCVQRKLLSCMGKIKIKFCRADSICPKLTKLSRPMDGTSFWLPLLASPGGKLDFLPSGTSEPIGKKA